MRRDARPKVYKLHRGRGPDRVHFPPSGPRRRVLLVYITGRLVPVFTSIPTPLHLRPGLSRSAPGGLALGAGRPMRFYREFTHVCRTFFYKYAQCS
jgi:hypothetical protein